MALYRRNERVLLGRPLSPSEAGRLRDNVRALLAEPPSPDEALLLRRSLTVTVERRTARMPVP